MAVIGSLTYGVLITQIRGATNLETKAWSTISEAC
jgi:hypothetical protein